MRTKEDIAVEMHGYVDMLAGRGFVVDDRASHGSAQAARPRRTRFGRVRMVLSGTRVRATVGPRTITLHECEGRGLAGVTIIATLDTSDKGGMAAALARLPMPAPASAGA